MSNARCKSVFHLAGPTGEMLGNIKDIKRDNINISKTHEFCCKHNNHTLNHTQSVDFLGDDVTAEYFSGLWKENVSDFMNKLVLADSLEKLDKIFNNLMRCPLKQTYSVKEKCKKILTYSELCTILNKESYELLNDYLRLIDEKRAEVGADLARAEAEYAALRAQGLFPHESYLNAKIYLENLLNIRDSNMYQYSPEIQNLRLKGKVMNFASIGIHPLTLQIVKPDGGCDYISFVDIRSEAGNLYKSFDSANKFFMSNEMCITCGRPCLDHKHLPIDGSDGLPDNTWGSTIETTYDDEGEILETTKVWLNYKDPSIRLEQENPPKEAGLFSNLPILSCGGRREMIARAWGIFTVFSNALSTNAVIDLTNSDFVEYKREAFALSHNLANNETVLTYIDSKINDKPSEDKFVQHDLERMIYQGSGSSAKYLIDMSISKSDVQNAIVRLEEKINKRGSGSSGGRKTRVRRRGSRKTRRTRK